MMWRGLAFVVSGFGVGLSACSPPYAGPDAPVHACSGISAADYDAAVAAGAAQATARVGKDGIVSIETGPGIVQCATFRGAAMLPCRRPNDFVIRYIVEDGETFHVRVLAGEQYRFNVQRIPNTCEVLEHQAP